MNKHKLVTFAVAGASLLAVSHARAQVNYQGDDLLLNFRNISQVLTSPSVSVSGNDLEVDLGNVSTFASSVPAGTTKTVVGASLVTGALATPSSSAIIGLSASAADDTTSTLWLSRVISGPTLNPPSPVSAQQVSQDGTVTAIDNIGAGAGAGTSDGLNAATVVAATLGNSYQAQGEANNNSSGVNNINFGSTQNTAANKGGLIEGSQNGGGNIYEALWEVPETGNGSDSYLGYFTFQSDGEVDFTAVPEPSMYGVLAAGGLLVLALRRQLGSLIA